MTTAMDKKNIQKQVVESIFIMNAAVTNLRLYPPSNPLTVSSIGRLFNSMLSIVEQADSVEYAESEKTLLVQGEPLSEKDMARNQVNSFLRILLDQGIRSITFEKGFTKDEITGFLQIIGKPSTEVENAGGIAQLLKAQRIEHIKIDEKIYVGMDSGQTIAASMAIRDEDIVRLITGEQADSGEVLDLVRELANDPEWISRVFQAGVKQMMQEAHNFPAEDLSEKFTDMISALNRISGKDKKEISQAILASLPDMDERMLFTIMSQNLDEIFGDDIFQQFIEQLDDEAFQRLISKIRKLEKEALKEGNKSHQQIHSIHRIFKLMVQSEKGKNLLGKVKVDSLTEESTETPEADPSKDIFASMATLFSQITPLLHYKDAEVRSTVAKLMSQIDEKLEESGLLDERIELSRKLSEWIRSETILTPAFEQVTANLEKLSRQLIENNRAEDANHILEAYSLIYSKKITKEEAIQSLAANMLQHLATDDILNVLLKETPSDGMKKRKDDIQTLIILGTTSIERLLDRLHDSHNRQERNRIIQVIVKIGTPAIHPVIERLQQQGPWYYRRNLTLLLGRIGSQETVKVLAPLIGNEDPRIQREVILAMGNLGGANSGKALVSNLASVDDEIKGLIISVLGTMKYRDAVPELINILDSKAAGTSKKAKNDIMIKACEALAKIEVKNAVPTLEKIIQAKGFLSIKAFDPAVRDAAAHALAKLKSQ
jgi:HEAT repeat protein